MQQPGATPATNYRSYHTTPAHLYCDDDEAPMGTLVDRDEEELPAPADTADVSTTTSHLFVAAGDDSAGDDA